MKTLQQKPIEPVYVSEIPQIQNMEQGKIYISKEYEVSNHLCLCGCGQETVLPIGNGEWSITDKDGKITITPSILQRARCQSHYIITNGIANFV